MNTSSFHTITPACLVESPAANVQDSARRCNRANEKASESPREYCRTSVAAQKKKGTRPPAPRCPPKRIEYLFRAFYLPKAHRNALARISRLGCLALLAPNGSPGSPNCRGAARAGERGTSDCASVEQPRGSATSQMRRKTSQVLHLRTGEEELTRRIGVQMPSSRCLQASQKRSSSAGSN